MTTDAEARRLLDLPLPENDSSADTVRGYLVALLGELWQQEQGFSGKRPFGNSGWQNDLYYPMVRAGIVPGGFDKWDCLEGFDQEAADELIQRAIKELAR